MLATMIVSFFTARKLDVWHEFDVERVLSQQVVGTTFLTIGGTYVVCYLILPNGTFHFPIGDTQFDATSFEVWLCIVIGVLQGLFGGMSTLYFTSPSYGPVQTLAKSCQTGAATCIINGLALGQISTIIPAICAGASVIFAHACAGAYGIGKKCLLFLIFLYLQYLKNIYHFLILFSHKFYCPIVVCVLFCV